MSTDTICMVRAGPDGAYAADFVSEGLVAIGWPDLGPLVPGVSRDQVYRLMAMKYSEAKPATSSVWVGNVVRFLNDIHTGHPVATYDPESRLYYLGTVISDPEWRNHRLARFRRVEWTAKVSRDLLSPSTRSALGPIGSLFQIAAEAGAELRTKAVPLSADVPSAREPVIEEAAEHDQTQEVLADILSRSQGFIEDRIVRLDWREMQELMAGLLPAMGYRTKVSEEGPDRGVDIFASRDGRGLEEPRIFVEVKHRTGTAIGAQHVRAFLGGRKAGDRCLFVSTGGFTKDAKYEADRSAVPLTLIGLPELRELLVQQYEDLDPATTALVPLKRIYWPAE